jgi:arylsulfatase A-like enzyme
MPLGWPLFTHTLPTVTPIVKTCVKENCGRTGGLKGSKGQNFEGGVRMPGLARWPGKFPAGTVSDELISTLDIFPTVLAAAGIFASGTLDGVNALPLLQDPLHGPRHF